MSFVTPLTGGGIGLTGVAGEPRVTVLTDVPADCSSVRAFAVGKTPEAIVACGFYYNAAYEQIPCAWTNGVRTDLAIPDSEAEYLGQALCIDESGTVIGGWVGTTDRTETNACYWRNDSLHKISDVPAGATTSIIHAIAVGSVANFIYRVLTRPHIGQVFHRVFKKL